MSPRALLENLKARGVTLEADGENLKVDAPAGVVTEEDRAGLVKFKPALLRILTQEACLPVRQANQRGLIIRWSEYPVWIKLHDPLTGEWHEVRASECLPSIVEAANKHKQKEGVWKQKAKPN